MTGRLHPPWCHSRSMSGRFPQLPSIPSMFTSLLLSRWFGGTDNAVTNTWGRQMRIIPGGGERHLPWSAKSLLMLGRIGAGKEAWLGPEGCHQPAPPPATVHLAKMCAGELWSAGTEARSASWKLERARPWVG